MYACIHMYMYIYIYMYMDTMVVCIGPQANSPALAQEAGLHPLEERLRSCNGQARGLRNSQTLCWLNLDIPGHDAATATATADAVLQRPPLP